MVGRPKSGQMSPLNTSIKTDTMVSIYVASFDVCNITSFSLMVIIITYYYFYQKKSQKSEKAQLPVSNLSASSWWAEYSINLSHLMLYPNMTD